MANTNLQQWNPTAANQETDVEYLADSQRAGGATDPSVFQSRLANKAFYQWSTYLTALFQAFANKGFTTSDSNLNTLTATCSAFLTTADKINIVTPLGGPILSATQAGPSYASTPSTAAIMGITQGDSSNVLFSAVDATGTANFWVRANGELRAGTLTAAGSVAAASANISGLLQAVAATISGLLQAGSAVVSGALSAGSAAVSGALSAASANIGGLVSANFLQARAYGTVPSQGASIMWNAFGGGGVGETDFVNYKGGGNGGFNWYNIASGSPSAASPIANLDPTGSLFLTGGIGVAGSIGGAAAVISGNLSAGSALVTGNLNVNSFQIGAAAPAGQVLTGDGAHYTPQPLPTYTLAAGMNDVTGARSFGPTYFNGGGVLYVTGSGNTSGGSVGSVQCFVNGDEVFANTVGSTVNNGTCGFSFVVPPGASYGIQANTLTNGQGSAVTGVRKWIETVVTI